MERDNPSEQYYGVDTPLVRVTDSIVLSWFNSRVRTFDDEALNHVEHKKPDGQVVGIRVARHILEMLIEYDFPMSYDPIVDDQTVDWFVRSELEKLDDEMREI